MSDKIDINAVREGILERLNRPIPPQVETDLSACTAIDKLSVSLEALRMALDAANQAPGMLGLPDENGHLTEACELHTRWFAATQLLESAIVSTRADGADVIKAVKTMLAID